MVKKNLFIDGANNYFLYSKKTITCDKCPNVLDHIFFMVWIWRKKRSDNFTLCKDCLMKVDNDGLVFEAKYGVVVDSVEPDFSPVFIEPPTFISGKKSETVFSAVEVHSDKITDKAWRSKEYPSLEGASIGKNVTELDNSLSPITMLEEEKKVLLESKGGDVND